MIAIISDVHGNYEALKEVLKDIDNKNIREIYCLGDIVGYYSQVNECCNELRRRNVFCVMGNHDWYMTSNTNCTRSKSVNDCLNYQRSIISLENREWIASFPVILHRHDVSMVHGGWKNPLDEYLEEDEEYFNSINGKFFVSGHSHKQKIQRFGEKIYCNPGSVGQPRDGDNRAAYATFDGKEFYLHRIEYNIEKTCMLMRMIGFEPYYFGGLWAGSPRLQKPNFLMPVYKTEEYTLFIYAGGRSPVVHYESELGEATFSISSGNMLRGNFMNKLHGSEIKKWILNNKMELMTMWKNQDIYEISHI